nr:trypsin-like serine protease [uncultured Mucilaginibacter sp.]
MTKFKLLFLLIVLTNVAFGQVDLSTKTADSTHNMVVAIMRLDSTGKILVRATGVLIHPRVILTAGHVSYKRYPDGIDRRGYISTSNTALQNSNYIPFDWINNVLTHPDQMAHQKSLKDTTGASDPSNYLDIGLIFLDTPITNRPIAALPKPSFFNTLPGVTTFLGVGYGYHKVRDKTFKYKAIDGRRRKWQPGTVTANNEKWLFGNARQQVVAVGDSGSPLLVDDHIIIGITSGTGDTINSSRFVRVDNPVVLGWIRDAVQQRFGVKL